MRATPVLLEGVPLDCTTVGFLVDVMDVAEDHGLYVEGISILRGEGGETFFVDRRP